MKIKIKDKDFPYLCSLLLKEKYPSKVCSIMEKKQTLDKMYWYYLNESDKEQDNTKAFEKTVKGYDISLARDLLKKIKNKILKQELEKKYDVKEDIVMSKRSYRYYDDDHFLNQLQKVITMNGSKKVVFENGEEVEIPVSYATKALRKYNSLKKADEKQLYMETLADSLESFVQNL